MGSIASGIGSQQQTQAQLNQLGFQAQVADQNAALAGTNAADALARGGTAAGRAVTQGSQVIGEQKNAYAASGVSTGVGSPLAAMADTRLLSDADAAMFHSNAAREAWGYRVQQQQFSQQAGFIRKYGIPDTAISGGVNQFNTMTNSITSAAGPVFSTLLTTPKK